MVVQEDFDVLRLVQTIALSVSPLVAIFTHVVRVLDDQCIMRSHRLGVGPSDLLRKTLATVLDVKAAQE